MSAPKLREAQAVPTVLRRTWVSALGLTSLTGLISLTGLMSLAGCATPFSAPAVDALSGRLSLQIGPQGQAPARQWSAGFELRGSARAGELDLTSPLGTLVAQARWKPGEAELQQGGEHRRFDSLQELARQLLGEAVPLEALFDWLRGRPWPQAPHSPTDLGFTQQGWGVDLSGLAGGVLLARRDAEPVVTLRARLVSAP